MISCKPHLFNCANRLRVSMDCWRPWTLLCLASLLLASAFGQQSPGQDLAEKLTRRSSQVLQEKLFLHSDKSAYLAGETLWFSLYDVDGCFHRPLNISKVAYIELLDINNKPVLQAKIALSQGAGQGSLYLPASLGTAPYKIRAYTSWMKNFSPDYFFEKTLSIINPQKAPPAEIHREASRYDIGFFPEGGNLVNGLSSRVAFRLADQYGRGLDGLGWVIDNNTDTIVSFRPLRFGLGSFGFTPRANHHYMAVVRFADGSRMQQALPPAYDAGFVMQLGPARGGMVSVSIGELSSGSPQSGERVYLLAQTRGVVHWAASQVMEQGKALFLVDSARLGEGISQFTLFNGHKQPVCERLYFTYPSRQLRLSIQADLPGYACRKKVSLDILSSDGRGVGRRSDLSMAVYRLDSLQPADELTIDNYLWLSSDLVGNIESPGYYFDHPGPQTMEAMDNLMLTQGWRRFRWEDIIQDRKPAFQFVPEYNGHIITGKLTDSRSGLPLRNVEAFLSVPGTNGQFRNALSDDQGNLKFELKRFSGSSEIILQTNPLQDSNSRFDINSPFSDKYSGGSMPGLEWPLKSPRSLLYASINGQVQRLFNEDNQLPGSLVLPDTAVFYAEPDEKYRLDDYTRFTTLEEIIREYVLAVNITRRSGQFHLVVTNKMTRERFSSDPLVLLDGVPVFDIDRFVTTVDPLKLNRLEVVERNYFLGYSHFDGILNFSSYKGDLGGYELDPHALALDYEGLKLQRTFYAPRYDTPQQASGHMPDFRSLLFWCPRLSPGEDGRLKTDFYTSDLPGRYMVLLQGLDASGTPGSNRIFFEVSEKGQ